MKNGRPCPYHTHLSVTILGQGLDQLLLQALALALLDLDRVVKLLLDLLLLQLQMTKDSDKQTEGMQCTQHAHFIIQPLHLIRICTYT